MSGGNIKKPRTRTPKQQLNLEKYLLEKREFLNRLNIVKNAGFYFTEEQEREFMRTPERPTNASIKALQKKTTEWLMNKSPYTIDTETGEISTRRDRKKAERKAQKADIHEHVFTGQDLYSNAVISVFRQELNSYNQNFADAMNSALNSAIQATSPQEVAQALQQANADGVSIARPDTYDKGKVQQYIRQILSYLPNTGAFGVDDIMDTLEADEVWEEWAYTEDAKWERRNGRKRYE